MKIRGTALQIAEKYSQLARDAQASGDRIQGESLLQHAEHYYRILAAAQAQTPQPPQQQGQGDRPSSGEDGEQRSNGYNEDRSLARPTQDPAFGLSDPQPYVNGNGQDKTEAEAPQPPAEQAESAADQPPPRSRSRRRRPYRERSEAQNAPEADPPAPAGDVKAGESGADSPTGDD